MSRVSDCGAVPFRVMVQGPFGMSFVLAHCLAGKPTDGRGAHLTVPRRRFCGRPTICSILPLRARAGSYAGPWTEEHVSSVISSSAVHRSFSNVQTLIHVPLSLLGACFARQLGPLRRRLDRRTLWTCLSILFCSRAPRFVAFLLRVAFQSTSLCAMWMLALQ